MRYLTSLRNHDASMWAWSQAITPPRVYVCAHSRQQYTLALDLPYRAGDLSTRTLVHSSVLCLRINIYCIVSYPDPYSHMRREKGSGNTAEFNNC